MSVIYDALVLQCRASSDRGGGFSAGFITGGVIFGALGFLFAPQVCPRAQHLVKQVAANLDMHVSGSKAGDVAATHQIHSNQKDCNKSE